MEVFFHPYWVEQRRTDRNDVIVQFDLHRNAMQQTKQGRVLQLPHKFLVVVKRVVRMS